MNGGRLLTSLFDDDDCTAIFSNEQLIRYLLDVEAALAAAQARLGIIPTEAANRIVQQAATLSVDQQALLAGIEKSGIPTIELVKQLRAHVGGEAASYVHWGATTQDIMDTALVLQIRAVLEIIEAQQQLLITNLIGLAGQHRATLMAGRTHSQQALPITFGLKVAGWLAPLLRHHQRLQEIKPRLLIVQFGGAAGTLASLGKDGIAVQEALAKELRLGASTLPWHTQRDTLAEFANWLSMFNASLAKMAQDIILMAQSEIGEIRETSDPARGGSSTMPQKSNPIISEFIIAAARTNASLLAAMHQAMIQEHERATHGWQMEWLNLPQMITLALSSLKKAAFLSENLVINEDRMRETIRASNGLMLAEAMSFSLTPYMGRAQAKELIKEACETALSENRHLIEVLRERIDPAISWEALPDESTYLGSTQELIDRVIHEARGAISS